MTGIDAGNTRREALLGLLGEVDGGVLVTLGRGGRPQLSHVNHHYYAEEGVISCLGLTEDRVKTRNLRRDPRASDHVTGADRWAWTVVTARPS